MLEIKKCPISDCDGKGIVREHSVLKKRFVQCSKCRLWADPCYKSKKAAISQWNRPAFFANVKLKRTEFNDEPGWRLMLVSRLEEGA